MDRVAHAIAHQAAQEHALESDRKRALLRRCGVAEEDLSKNGQVYLHVLSEVAELLALKDTRNSSYLMAMTGLEDALDSAERQARVLRDVADESSRRSQELAREWTQLEAVKQQLEDAVDERENHENTTTMVQRTEELNEKRRAYEDELTRLRATLEGLGFDESHRDKPEHQALSALEGECEAIERQSRLLSDQLRRFHGLPLGEELAAAQLVDARAELQRLEDQFSSQIQQML